MEPKYISRFRSSNVSFDKYMAKSLEVKKVAKLVAEDVRRILASSSVAKEKSREKKSK